MVNGHRCQPPNAEIRQKTWVRHVTFGLIAAMIFFAWSCAPKPVPRLVVPPVSVGDGGRLLRQLYRSYWHVPSSDQETLLVGIIPSTPKLRFQALGDMRIRILSETSRMEVASPSGVIWEVVPHSWVRPAVVSYFSVVQTRLIHSCAPPPETLVEKWKTRGFLAARWIGAPVMDEEKPHYPLERRVLAVSLPTDESVAKGICENVRKTWGGPCNVIARVELPALARATLRAQNSNFEQTYDGILELVSPKKPVRILDIVFEERTGDRSFAHYGPSLYVVPSLSREMALVQATPLETYLQGVLPSEIFPNAPKEALRAQAVVARTYTLRHVEPRGWAKPFVLCASTRCQVYRGEVIERGATPGAIADTANLVLWDRDDHLAETFYHSICGGRTEPRQTIWGPPARSYLAGSSDLLPGQPPSPLLTDDAVRKYLRSAPHSYCGIASFLKPDRWRWNKAFQSKDIDGILHQLGLSPPLIDFSVVKRGPSGRVLALKLVTKEKSKTVNGQLRIRTLLGGLRSALFVLDLTQGEQGIHAFTLHGAAGGHGVGMCQTGAIGRAERGQTFAQILQAYYPGTRLAPVAACR